MKELFNSIILMFTLIVKTVVNLVQVMFNLGEATVHVSEVVVDAGEAFKLQERLDNAAKLAELRKKYQTTEQE